MKKFRILIISIIVVLCIALTTKTFQNDTFYTIKLGELILNNGIDMLDHFSIHTLPYTYPHWFYDVFIYIIYHFFSFTGIYISTIILFIILMLMIYYTNLKLYKKELSVAFISIISIMGLSNFATARAQLVSYILFALEFYFIEKFLQTKEKKYPIFLILISLILCNIHVAVWPFYFILYLPFIVEYIIAKLFKKKSILWGRIRIEKNDNVKYLVIIMLCSVLTGLITPIGDTPYTYLYNTMIGNSQNYIKEHQSTDVLGQVYLIIFLAEYLLLGILSHTKLRYLFLVIGLSIMSFTSNRHVALFVILFAPCFIDEINNFLDNTKLNVDKLIKYITGKISICIVSIILISLLAFTINNNKDKEYFSNENYPIKASDYIINNLDYKNIRLFNEYNYGSYLLFRGIPVFIDSRADLYTREFSGLSYDIFDDYMKHGVNYNEIIEFYDITHIILNKENSLYTVFLYSDDYIKLYEDESFILFEKKLS